MEYVVEFIVKSPHWVTVEAETKEEAIEKAKRGDIIEGSQDSEPGDADRKTYRVR